MRSQRLTLGLTVVNLALLALLVLVGAQARQETGDVVRGRALELTDPSGNVRAQIDVEESGEVVLRLRDETGAIRVKLGAGEDGSGLLLLDEETDPAIHMIARAQASESRPTTTSISLRASDGRKQVFTPER